MVDIRVSFAFMQKQWTHSFRVDRGATVLKLKELMLKSRGAEADFAAFELRKEGQRVALPDAEALLQDENLDFRWLSEKRRARRAARAARKDGAAGSLVQVTVRHAQLEKESSIVVWVYPDATLNTVRMEIMARLGETRRSEVRLVTKQGNSFASLPDGERINGRREFLSMGRKLEGGGGEGGGPLTLEQALALQRELLVGFSDEAFQRELMDAEKEHGRSSRKFLSKRQALALSVQSRILPKYGFEGSPKGVMKMMEAMNPLGPALGEVGQRIEVLLRYRDPPAQEQQPSAEARQGADSREVPVCVQWDPNDPSKEANVSLPRACNLFQVKQVLCAGDPSGSSKPEHFFLALEKMPDQPLPDDLCVSEALGKLKLIPWTMTPGS